MIPPDHNLDVAEARRLIERAEKLRQDTRGEDHCEAFPWDDISEQAKVAWVLLALREAEKQAQVPAPPDGPRPKHAKPRKPRHQ